GWASSGEMEEDALAALYLLHLKRIKPLFDESWIDGRWLFRAAGAQPVFTLGAGARLAGHRSPVRGLYLANMAQIYSQDRGQNYSILLGERVAEVISEDLSRDGIPPVPPTDAVPAPFSPD